MRIGIGKVWPMDAMASSPARPDGGGGAGGGGGLDAAAMLALPPAGIHPPPPRQDWPSVEHFETCLRPRQGCADPQAAAPAGGGRGDGASERTGGASMGGASG